VSYINKILIALDQVVNTLLLGEPDETLSSRAYRMEQKGQPYWGWTAKAINCIFFWQENHCRGSYAKEKARAHLPKDF